MLNYFLFHFKQFIYNLCKTAYGGYWVSVSKWVFYPTLVSKFFLTCVAVSTGGQETFPFVCNFDLIFEVGFLDIRATQLPRVGNCSLIEWLLLLPGTGSIIRNFLLFIVLWQSAIYTYICEFDINILIRK